jgi:excisionase family DNA binding protein
MPIKKTPHSIAETAKILGIGRKTAMEAVANGQIPSVRIGKRLKVPRLALARLLEGASGTVGK